MRLPTDTEERLLVMIIFRMRKKNIIVQSIVAWLVVSTSKGTFLFHVNRARSQKAEKRQVARQVDECPENSSKLAVRRIF